MEEKVNKKSKSTEVETSQKVEKDYWYGLGRRKTAIAKVKLTKGTGKITVNGEDLANPSRVYLEPLKVLGQEKNFNVQAKTIGGGIISQLGAIRLGIARALDKFDSEWHTTLKKEGFLTRDPRMKERKKPGLRGARRAPQWTKR